jgi:hypothetical protein
MARRFTETIAASAGGSTFSDAFVVDTYNNPCNIGIGVNIDFGVGSAIYTVQHTFDDPFTINLNNRALGTWLDNDSLVSANVSNDTNYAFPPTAIRLRLFPAASAQCTMTIIQAGPEN